MKAVKVLLISIAALVAAMIVIPLTILAGLFVWLKLTEETDDEELELDDAICVGQEPMTRVGRRLRPARPGGRDRLRRPPPVLHQLLDGQLTGFSPR
jgi:hypothetical protein